MKRSLLVLLFVLVLCASARADKLVWVDSELVKPPPITNRIVFVVDVSGSMRGMPIAIASTKVLEIMAESKDEAFVKIYVFNDTCWSLGEGWWKLPDRELLETIAGEKFLDLSAEGDTDIAGALATAMQENTEEGISFVLLTDGEPSGDTEIHLAEVDRVQLERVRSGDGQAVIHVYGIRENPKGLAHAGSLEFMKELALSSGGGCMITQPRLLH